MKKEKKGERQIVRHEYGEMKIEGQNDQIKLNEWKLEERERKKERKTDIEENEERDEQINKKCRW